MAPSVETSGKSFRLFAHNGQEQLPGFVRLFGPQVLNVDLRRLVAQFDLDLGATGAHPQENVLTWEWKIREKNQKKRVNQLWKLFFAMIMVNTKYSGLFFGGFSAIKTKSSCQNLEFVDSFPEFFGKSLSFSQSPWVFLEFLEFSYFTFCVLIFALKT